MKEANKLQAEMMDNIREAGAWFDIGREKYVKIEYSEIDNLYLARECDLKKKDMEAKAYTFGSDWFDISFHGKYIDIYADADTFKKWEIWYEPGKGTQSKSSYKSLDIGKRIIEFCTKADSEALSGPSPCYEISGTNFDLLASKVEAQI